jgi:hypothetical protein
MSSNISTGSPSWSEPKWCEYQSGIESKLRREGLFDAADIYRELTARFPCDDVCVFDRGRPGALAVLLDDAIDWKRWLTIYPEGA